MSSRMAKGGLGRIMLAHTHIYTRSNPTAFVLSHLNQVSMETDRTIVRSWQLENKQLNWWILLLKFHWKYVLQTAVLDVTFRTNCGKFSLLCGGHVLRRTLHVFYARVSHALLWKAVYRSCSVIYSCVLCDKKRVR